MTILRHPVLCNEKEIGMPKSYNQKMKILYIMKILLEKTDEEHVLSMQEILDELGRYDIKAERKSIYDDIEALRLFGLDIVNRKERPAGYYVAGRQFELPELKLLVDAVQSSKFITTKKSNELIKKIESLTSKYEAGHLQRQVFVTNRIKAMNESIYYNVDKIHSAISENVQIAFQYFEWTVEKEMRLKKNGEKYCISPWALTWDDENYYLIGFDKEADMVKHYRVDKMKSIEILKEKRLGKEHFIHFDTADYAKKMFGMFGGEEIGLTLRMDDHFIGVMIDRFGKDITVRSRRDGTFDAKIKVAVSGQFFGWLSGLGTGAVIVSPAEVAEDYKQYLHNILAQYKSD